MDIHSTLKTVVPELSSELRQHLMTIGELEHYEKDELILDYGCLLYTSPSPRD